MAKPLEELTKITHVGAPIVLKIVAEEIRTSREEPPAQATVVELGLLLGEPGNSPPYFENDKLVYHGRNISAFFFSSKLPRVNLRLEL